ncbi:MAG: hypothetical protein C4540_03995 [Candidatus Omnitrophota bacterium]|jgi:type IV secretory pathway TrbF-like protein|nr:MAG: hypothetical protein C4540_03995 [Candidatus Omnitrophota bacterium]
MMTALSSRRREKGFALGLIGLLLTAAIVCYMFYLLLKTYYKPFVPANETAGVSLDVSVPAQNYQSVVSNTRQQIQNITRTHSQQLDNF